MPARSFLPVQPWLQSPWQDSPNEDFAVLDDVQEIETFEAGTNATALPISFGVIDGGADGGGANGSWTFSNEYPREGALGSKVTVTVASSWSRQIHIGTDQALGSTRDTCHLTAAVQFSTVTPGATIPFLQARRSDATTTAQAQIALVDGGIVRVRNPFAGVGDLTTRLQPLTTYLFQWRVDTRTQSQRVRLYDWSGGLLEETPDLTFTGLPFDQFTHGVLINPVNVPFTAWFDWVGYRTVGWPTQPAAPTNPAPAPRSAGRVRRLQPAGLARPRRRTATPTPTVEVPPAVDLASRRRPGLRRGSTRTSTPVREQLNPPLAPDSRPVDRRLVARVRSHLATPVPAQAAAPAPGFTPEARRERRWLARRTRPATAVPLGITDIPPSAGARRRAGARRGPGRAATPVPAQVTAVNPPTVPDSRDRVRRLVARVRSHLATPVPAQTVAPAPAFTPEARRERRWLARRTRPTSLQPVTTADTPPSAVQAGRRRAGARRGPGRAATPVPAQATLITPATIPDARAVDRRLLARVRSHLATPVPAQASPVAPATVPDTRTRARRLLRLPRHATTVPATEQTPPAARRARQPLTARLRGPRPATQSPAEQGAPQAPGARPARRRTSWFRRRSTRPPLGQASTTAGTVTGATRTAAAVTGQDRPAGGATGVTRAAATAALVDRTAGAATPTTRQQGTVTGTQREG